MDSTLVLVPTGFELEYLSSAFIGIIKDAKSQLGICGFGPIISAIRTSRLIAEHSPKQIVLIGVAGALDSRYAVGTAVEFDAAICFGVGAGCGEDFLSASELGWKHWPCDPEIADTIYLRNDRLDASVPLLTGCSTSANQQEVQWRLKKYPKAAAEDMEGFSVAAACRFAGIPLRIIRGISNRAGDRDKKNWRVGEAMASVEKAIREVFAS